MKNDTTVTCQQGRGEQVYIKSMSGHNNVLDTVIAGHTDFGPLPQSTISGPSWS